MDGLSLVAAEKEGLAVALQAVRKVGLKRGVAHGEEGVEAEGGRPHHSRPLQNVRASSRGAAERKERASAQTATSITLELL